MILSRQICYKEFIMNMYMKYGIMFCMMITVSSCASESSRLNLAENIVIGGIVGAAEVAMPGQILTYGMNQAILKNPFILADSYKGFGANALGQMPITAMQKATQSSLTELIEQGQATKLSDTQKMGVSYLSGIAGAMIDTPSNAIQLELQKSCNKGKNSMQVARQLGFKSWRGFGANALMKEGPFAVGYQYLAEKGKQAVEPYLGDNIASVAVGGSIAGVATALVTQPGAVIRNTMQSDLFRDKSLYETTWKTAKHIYREQGVTGLFAGLKARGIRVAIAVPLYVMYTTKLEEFVKSWQK